MRRRTFGATGWSVSELALGTMMFGAMGNTDHDDSARIINRALDAGINLVDTADVYSQWFAGGVVAYRNATKYRLLGVPEGPVITPECARAMAFGVLAATGADVAVAVTGVGGPGEEEGRRAGTVFICAASADAQRGVDHVFDGDPAEVVALTVEHALRHLGGALRAPG